MPRKMRIFIMIAAVFGTLQLFVSALHWRGANPTLFLLYLSMAVICSFFQARRLRAGVPFSLNLPFILLSMVQLSRAEAVVVGSVGMLAQCLWDPQTRSRLSQIALRTSIFATVIATADFVYRSLIPHSMQNGTLLLLVASVSLFFANTFPAAIVQRLGESRRIGRIWKECYFWSFPYYLVAAVVANAVRMAGSGVLQESTLLVIPVLYLAYRHYRMQRSQLEEKEKYAANMAELHLRAIEGLALAVEAKDNLNTRGHLRRVQVYALGMGRDLGLSAGELEALHAAALLHDIGKLAVPEHILTKPGKLSPEEFAKMKVHPVVGAEIVEQVQFPYPVAPIVRAHHEKWDGSGYPFGLKGEEIPLSARILTAADCLDALTSDREYRRGLPLEEGMRQIASEAGTSFDPAVVEVLQRRHLELDLMARENADQHAVLSTNVAVEKGKTPGAGLDLSCITDLAGGAKPLDFQAAIAAAGREGQLRHEMALRLGASLDLDETLQHIERSLQPVIPSDALAIFLTKGNTLVVEHAAGRNQEMLLSLSVPMGEGLVGWVAQNGRPVANGNPTVEPGFHCGADHPLNACMALPLEGPGGLLGVLALYRGDKDAFTHDHLRILTDAAPQIGAAVDNALKFREMEVQANTDSVTKLPNARLMMRLLESELARARRQKLSLCVATCRLTGLPALSQRLGQHAAAEFLRRAAKGMKDTCREYDFVARMGEDRFGFVLPGMRSQDAAGKTAKLDAIVSEAERGDGSHGSLCLTFGQAFYPEDGDGARTLVEIAEHRMDRSSSSPTASLMALDALAQTEPARPAEVLVKAERAG